MGTRDSNERPGREHERLTAALSECLRDALGPSTQIQTPERVRGKSGTIREIDVSARGLSEGEAFCVAIECKDKGKQTGIETVDAFVGKLIDVSATLGIMVVSLGYTRDALRRAATAGIQTYVLREATDRELQGRLELRGSISALGIALHDCEIELKDGRVLSAPPTAMFRDPQGRTLFLDQLFQSALAQIQWEDDRVTELTTAQALTRTLDNESPEVAKIRARPRRTTLFTTEAHVRWDALLIRYDGAGEVVRDFLSLRDLRSRAEAYRAL